MMKKKTLLQIAQEMDVNSRSLPPNYEELEVVVAYIKAEITVRQAAAALRMKAPGNFTHRVASVLHWGFERGYLKLKISR